MEVKKKQRMIFRSGCIIGITVLIVFSLNACLIVFSLSAYWEKNNKTYKEVYKNNWGIDLPDNMTVEFYKSRFVDPGDEFRYTVLKAQEEPADFIADFSREKKFNGPFIITSFVIPENYLPDWEAEYCWKYMEKDYDETMGYMDLMYIVYFPDSLVFIIWESFS